MSEERRVALVTGAGAGIGRAVVERYVSDGILVGALDLAEDRLADLAAPLGEAVLPITGDVSRWEDNERAVAETVAHFGRLDVLVANAGISDHAVGLADLSGEQLSAGFDELFAINVRSCVLGARAALEPLLQTRGCMILTASYASFFPAGGGILYTASKHAVLGLVRQLAYELAPDIRVNGVAPGVAPTTLGGVASLGQRPQDSVLPGSERMLPMAEIPEAAAYGGIYALLASPKDAGHITGSVVSADSGLSIRGIAQPSRRTSAPDR